MNSFHLKQNKWVDAPVTTSSTQVNAVKGVMVGENEEVRWFYAHDTDGNTYTSGYELVKITPVFQMVTEKYSDNCDCDICKSYRRKK